MASALSSPSQFGLRRGRASLKDTTMERSHATSFTGNSSTTTMATIGRAGRQEPYKFAAPSLERPSSRDKQNSSAAENRSPGKRADRFIPSSHNGNAISGALAEACGIKTNRILEFRNMPPKQGFYSDFVSQYTLQRPQSVSTKRRIASSAMRILDAPGIINDFYLNVLDWSAANNTMAIGLGNAVYSWNGNTGEADVIAEFSNGTIATSVKWAEDDPYIAIGLSSGDIQIWDAQEGIKLRSLRGRTDRVSSLGWNGPFLSSGGREGSIWNHDVRIKQHKTSEMSAHAGEVCGLAWRPSDRHILASGGNDNAVMLWDSRVASVPRHALHQHQAAVKALSWCPWQSNLLATGGGSADQQLHFWNTTTGVKLNSVHAGAQIMGLHWNSEYREIVAAMGYPTNSLAVWSYPSLEKQTEILGAHESRILNAALSPDGQTLVTSSADENIKFWNIFASSGGARSKFKEFGNSSFAGLGRV